MAKCHFLYSNMGTFGKNHIVLINQLLIMTILMLMMTLYDDDDDNDDCDDDCNDGDYDDNEIIRRQYAESWKRMQELRAQIQVALF